MQKPTTQRKADISHPADPAAQDEAQWLNAARTHPDRFTPLYERYFARVYAYCLRRVDSEQEAEDLTSTIFIRALNGAASYQGGSVAAWLFAIAHHTVANHYRAGHPHVPLEEAAFTIRDERPGPDEQVIQAERDSMLRALIRELPEDQQNLLALKLVAGLSAPEIADVVGKTPGAVRVALHRIVDRLRRRFTEIAELQGDEA